MFIIQGPLYTAFGIKESNFAEGQGVVLQQMAAIVKEGGRISKEEAEFINQIISLDRIPDAYTAKTVDTLKGSPYFNHEFLNNHKLEFIKVSKNLILNNPEIALKSWLLTTQGFWGTMTWVEPFAITWPNEELSIYQVNYIKKLFNIDLEFISNGILLRIGEVPVIGCFFRIGVLGWFGFYVLLRQIVKRRKAAIAALIPLNALWIVLILTTPIFVEVRYMFVYYLVFPFLVSLLFMGEQLKSCHETG